MSLIRPEVLRQLSRLKEVIASVAVMLFGLWLITLGGFLLFPIGILALSVGAALGFSALRRLRFQREVSAPGVVELDEGRISYYGPFGGGAVDMRELTEIGLSGGEGQRFWRLAQPGQGALLVPISAEGAESLFDAFVTVPGFDMGRASQALDRTDGQAVVIWTRSVLTKG